jgi:hypothetical protein
VTRRFDPTTPERGRRRLVIAGAALVALIVAIGLISTLERSGSQTPANRPRAGQSQSIPEGTGDRSSPLPSLPSSGWKPVAPATTVPTDSPIQQQYDQGFEQGFSSTANQHQLAEIEALALPAPAIKDSWPSISPAYTPDGWVRRFVEGLLDIHFARQSRNGLGAWLVAQEAPDLMPGIPVDAQLATLYATVLDSAITGQASPIPSASEWQAYAAAGARWSVSDLQVELDPQWQSMIAAGWQPVDLYASVEDVSGMLTTIKGSSATTKAFSLEVQLGSAHWHPGYGTVLLSGWKEEQ